MVEPPGVLFSVDAVGIASGCVGAVRGVVLSILDELALEERPDSEALCVSCVVGSPRGEVSETAALSGPARLPPRSDMLSLLSDVSGVL